MATKKRSAKAPRASSKKAPTKSGKPQADALEAPSGTPRARARAQRKTAGDSDRAAARALRGAQRDREAETQPPRRSVHETPGERASRKKAELEQRALRREQANAGAKAEKEAVSGGDIVNLDTRRKKAPFPSKAPPPTDTVTLPLTPLEAARLEAKTAKHEAERARVAAELKSRLQAYMAQAIESAVAKDARCVETLQEQRKVLNEILDAHEGELPDGYSVSQISDKEGLLVATYNPESRGRRLPIPDLPKEKG